MHWLYCRSRSHGAQTFLEFYLCREASGALALPTDALARFAGRESQVGSVINVSRLGPDLCRPPLGHSGALPVQIYVQPVKSVAASKPGRRTRADIGTDGVWAVYQDCVPRGGPLGPSIAAYFGLQVDPMLHRLLHYTIFDVYAAAKSAWPALDIKADPFVVYHGTSRDAVKSILAEGLKPSFGMLGTAVYFGHFWKAFRFATLTQDYKRRPGAILRCLAIWPKFTVKTMASAPCKCAKCLGPSLMGTPAARYADHDAMWALVAPVVMAFPEPGAPIKNEEYACRDASTVLVDCIAHAVAQTEHHEPLRRDLEIE